MPALSFPELLESRIAPATFVSAFEVQYAEGDGDLVKVQITRPVFHDDLREFTFVPDGAGERLQTLTLAATARAASLTISADPAGGGLGLAIVGAIEADTDLLNITVDGALGRTLVGDAIPTTPAMQTLTVDSLGGVPGISTASEIRGHAGSVVVAGDVSEASVHVAGNLFRLSIGGSLLGGAADDSGTVRVDGRLTRVEVGDSVRGAGGVESGSIFAGLLATTILRGDLAGGSGDGSGQLFGGLVGQVKIAGDLIGGSAEPVEGARYHGSGVIFGERSVGSVRIAGSVVGGSGPASGVVVSGGALGQIEISGDLLGGSASRSGIIRAQGDLGTVIIHGSAIGGDGSESASIRAGEVALQPSGFYERSIVHLEIGGDLRGGAGDLSGFIEAPRTLASFDIGGSIIGGNARGGAIGATKLGRGHVGGDVRGGEVPLGTGFSGTIGGGSAGSVEIDGSLIEGATGGGGSVAFDRLGRVIVGGDVSGTITGGSALGFLEIKGSLVAMEGLVSARIDAASIGAVHIHGSIRNVHTTYLDGGSAFVAGGFYVGRIGSMVVDGGIYARDFDSTEPAITSYAVLASGKVGSLSVHGELVGTASNRIGLASGALTVTFGSYGNEPAPATAGFGRIIVDGSVRFAELNAGSAFTERSPDGRYYGLNPDARIASVIVRGSWTASTLTAGVDPGFDGQYGTADDTTDALRTPETAARSTIGSVVIFGRVAGTVTPGDAFAIQAQRIGFASIGGKVLPLTAGLDDFPLAPATGDVRLRELGA